jgi:hypothetical protein
VLDSTELLAVLMPALQRHVLSSPVIFTDDTTLALQAPARRSPPACGSIWPAGRRRTTRGSGRKWPRPHSTTSRPIDPGRTRRRILGAWRGYLQADDYSGYHASFREGVTHVACWAHVRRKFFDVAKAAPKGAPPGLADDALRFTGLIYRIERRLAEADPDVRLRGAPGRTRRVLTAFHRWLTHHHPTLLPRSPLGRGCHALSNWTALTVFADSGTARAGQQYRRAGDAAGGDLEEELAVCRQPTWRTGCRRGTLADRNRALERH